MEDDRIKKGAVVQLNENAREEFVGCFLLVEKKTSWGATGFVSGLGDKRVYHRPTYDQMDYIGMATLLPEDWNSDEDDS